MYSAPGGEPVHKIIKEENYINNINILERGGTRMAREEQVVKVKVTFTEGHEQRFTKAILRIYANRIRKQREAEEKEEKGEGMIA